MFITGSGLEPHHNLVRLVVVSLTAEHSGGCVLWVAGNGWSVFCNFQGWQFGHKDTRTHTEHQMNECYSPYN